MLKIVWSEDYCHAAKELKILFTFLDYTKRGPRRQQEKKVQNNQIKIIVKGESRREIILISEATIAADNQRPTLQPWGC